MKNQKMENFFIKNKKYLFLGTYALLIVAFFSMILLLIGSVFIETKFLIIISIVVFLLSYLLLVGDFVIISLLKEKLFTDDTKVKMRFMSIFSIIAIPASLFLAWIVIFSISFIPGFFSDVFYKVYFYIYFLPIIFIILNGTTNFLKIRKWNKLKAI
ncbi:MAG: hypothetical protein KFW07_03205 [Mycoplasmataceae bacterium]|nr:hypothetical protein [Mycoplasmataceae bacterium]